MSELSTCLPAIGSEGLPGADGPDKEFRRGDPVFLTGENDQAKRKYWGGLESIYKTNKCNIIYIHFDIFGNIVMQRNDRITNKERKQT